MREFGNRFAEIDYKTSGGTDNYNSMQITLNRRYAPAFRWACSTAGRTASAIPAAATKPTRPAIPINFAADRGSNNFDIRHSFNLTALYDLPFGKGKKYMKDAPAAADLLLGGWQLGGVVNARTGVPIDVLITRPDLAYRDTRDGSIYANPVVVNGAVMTVPVINTPRRRQQPQRAASGRRGRSRSVPQERAQLAQSRGLLDSGRGHLRQLVAQQPDRSRPAAVRYHAEQEVPRRRREERGVPLRTLQHLQPREFRQPRQSSPGRGAADGSGEPGCSPAWPFSPSTAGGNFGVLTSTVSNQIGIGTNRQIQLSLRLNF